MKCAKRIVFDRPPHSSFPNHVDCCDALQGPPRALKRAVALGEPDSLLHDSLILLDHIIQFALAKANSTRHRTLRRAWPSAETRSVTPTSSWKRLGARIASK
jgi:hypothetical protein